MLEASTVMLVGPTLYTASNREFSLPEGKMEKPAQEMALEQWASAQ
jgi:hypothetical protein